MGLLDVRLLDGLVAAGQQHDQDVSVLQEGDPAARAEVHSQFGDAFTDRPHITRISVREPGTCSEIAVFDTPADTRLDDLVMERGR